MEQTISAILDDTKRRHCLASDSALARHITAAGFAATRQSVRRWRENGIIRQSDQVRAARALDVAVEVIAAASARKAHENRAAS